MTFDVYSMGFSNRTWDDTIAILRKFEIHRLVDIRTLPGSKHTPQFNQEHLQQTLPQSEIQYVHMKSLGGLRKPDKNSTTNSAWRNDSFRGYADYMQSPQFETALNELMGLFRESTTAYACTEAVFWRCHRQLVSDALTVRGYRVGHIFSAAKVEQHKLTEFLKAHGTRVTYPSLL
jgi:uncharacterized protein (DUF488 family)